MTREIFIPVGRGTSSEVYVDGAACVAQYINLEKVSRLKNHAGQTMNFTGDEMRAIVAKDERNHKYYRDYIPEVGTQNSEPEHQQQEPLLAITHKTVLTENKAVMQPPTPPAPLTKIAKLTTIDYNTLMKQEYAPLIFSINEILPQGLFILAGAPKIGKSWLILDMCHSIATGAELWGYNTTKSDVL